MIRRAHPSRIRSSRWSRPGLTFVEVIVSLGIVATGAALVFGAIGFMESVATYNRHRLNGTEIAHRVILQTIDDFKSLRGQVKRVEMGGHMYTWEVEQEVLLDEVGIDPAGPRKASQRRKSVKAENVPFEDRMAAQIHQIVVHVYVERPDGSRSPQPVATLTRSYNPLMGLGTRGMKYMLEMMQQATGKRFEG